jgi:hypothetical protein
MEKFSDRVLEKYPRVMVWMERVESRESYAASV